VIADKMGVTVGNITITKHINEIEFPQVWISNDFSVFLSESIIARFTSEEIDFLVAYKLASKVCKENMLLIMCSCICFIAVLIVISPGMIAMPTHLSFTNIAHELLKMAAMLVYTIIFSVFAFLQDRLRFVKRNRMALQITRNLPAAISALEKIDQDSTRLGLIISVSRLSFRKKILERAARQF